jgi:methyltransferase
MPTNPIVQKIEQMVAAYFEACKMQDAKAISACFAPGAVHYLPHRPPLYGGATIGSALVNDLRNRGGRYFIDKVLANVEQCAAGVEWSRTFQQDDRILRGYEFCEFDPASMLIREIRGYYAAPPHQDIARHELVGFDYAGRGYTYAS